MPALVSSLLLQPAEHRRARLVVGALPTTSRHELETEVVVKMPSRLSTALHQLMNEVMDAFGDHTVYVALRRQGAATCRALRRSRHRYRLEHIRALKALLRVLQSVLENERALGPCRLWVFELVLQCFVYGVRDIRDLTDGMGTMGRRNPGLQWVEERLYPVLLEREEVWDPDDVRSMTQDIAFLASVDSDLL